MMISEFIERTGFEPTAAEYAKIEKAYYDFDGDMDAFCEAFIKDGGVRKLCKARAVEIDRLSSLLLESERQSKRNIADREKRIAELTTELDRELEWKPSGSAGTNMEQKHYDELVKYGKTMTDEEVKAFIADECGFAPEKICILHEVSTYEINKHRRLRKSGAFDRVPVYESTDWNYIRFDCAQFMYELINGKLHFYNC